MKTFEINISVSLHLYITVNINGILKYPHPQSGNHCHSCLDTVLMVTYFRLYSYFCLFFTVINLFFTVIFVADYVYMHGIIQLLMILQLNDTPVSFRTVACSLHTLHLIYIYPNHFQIFKIQSLWCHISVLANKDMAK